MSFPARRALRISPVVTTLPSRGATLADWQDEQHSELLEAREAAKFARTTGCVFGECSCCCCTGACADSDDREDSSGEATVPSHWQPEGEGVYSFGVITSWYDDDSSWFIPEGWECFRRESGREDQSDLKRYESAEKVWVRPLPPPVECDVAPLRVSLSLAA
jgi:hypothetical protein